jgi:hypothetical protein
MLSSVNADDFTTGKESEMDAQLLVRFFYKDKENKAESALKGRPIFKEVEYCEIRVRGSRDAQACRPATYSDKNRFPRHYEAFKKRVEMPEEGTPLAEWPQISRSQIEEMSFLGIKTVEQVSLASDTSMGKMHGGYTLKQRAADWLKSSNATALIANNQALKTQIKSLEDKVATLMGKIEEIMTTPKPSLLEEAVEVKPKTLKKPRQRKD